MITPMNGDLILVVKPQWVERILQEGKTIEVRGSRCNLRPNTIIFLSSSKSSSIQGYVTFKRCEGPVCSERWNNTFELHQNRQDFPTVKYKRVFFWHLEHPHVFPQAIPYEVKRGSVIWRKYHTPPSNETVGIVPQ